MENLITVICPVYNEKEHIGKLLEFLTTSEPKEKELLIIDGGSVDGTREIVLKCSKKNSKIKLIDNPNRAVPFALNFGVKNSNGDIIVRIDAHTVYSPDYFKKILETFDKTDADIVGGPMRIKVSSSFQKAVAHATSSIFGVGDSKIHNMKYSGYTDHVYLGAWRRIIFKEIGYFDERLIRNQDDEFHYRAKSKGKKIYLNTEIKSFYYPRSDFKTLIKQYFQYGFYKPIVLNKVKTEIKIRHLVPSVFFLYCFIITFYFEYLILQLPLISYLFINFYFSFSQKGKIATKILTVVVYSAIHLSYGFGFISGVFILVISPIYKKVFKKQNEL
jgi:glycosyltransferase involved in cell wall biosynthesis